MRDARHTPSPVHEGHTWSKSTYNGLGERVKMESKEHLYILPNSVIISLVKDLNY